MRATLPGLLVTLLLVGCTSETPVKLAGDRSPPTKLAEPSGYAFEAPIQLTAGGEPIAVESPGFACPTMADVDSDGQVDLVVGQFNNGKLHFFRNIAASGESPKFAKGEFISSGDEPAIVPGVW